MGGESPASINKIFHPSISLRRLATTEPAEPAPTTIKSYSSKHPVEYSAYLVFDRKFIQKKKTSFYLPVSMASGP